ncbi:Mediator of RNA polymerase II transcription subunit 1 [Taenia crassiceps]|uniref:Mediator of RNA polymerase II transcription subunit 1 n=1 Tax=Taenia crassiceps TaxID=6207 RepID=A0ABR4QF56_9CEST
MMSFPSHSHHSEYIVAQRQAIENCIETISRIRALSSPDPCQQHVRFATLRNQLYRIALQCDLQLGDTGPILPPGLSSSGGIAWRISADCFSVVISAIPADGYSLPPGTTPPEDYPVSVAAVHFEFNQDKPIALEQDLLMLTTAVSNRISNAVTPLSLEPPSLSWKIANSPGDVNCLAQSINASAVGQVVQRTGGAFTVLTYFVSAVQKAIAMSHASKHSNRTEPEAGMLGGFCASVGLRATANANQHSLPLVSLVNIIKNADGYNVAQFTNADGITRVSIAAEFFLRLHPPLLFDVESILEIEAITKISMDHLKKSEPLPLHYLLLRRHNQEGLSSIDVHMTLPNKVQHAYHVVSNNLRGYVVNEIAFTCPSQLPPLIQLLRRKAAWLSFVESFLLHPRKPAVKDEDLTYRFCVNLPSQNGVLISFQHPLCSRRQVKVSIHMGDLGVSEARVLGAVLPEGFLFDPEQNKVKENGNNDKYDPTGILARSHSLPVALTWLLLQLGCPAVKMLTSTFPDKSVTSNGTCKTTKLVGQRRSAVYLARARNALHLSDDASADGLLAGADKLSEKSLQDAERLFLGDGVEGGTGILYDPTAGTTPSWPVLQPSQPLPPLPSQQFPPRPLLPPGVMATTPPAGLTSDQLSVPTPKGLDDTFPSPALSSNNQSFRSIPVIPGVMTTSATSLFGQPMKPPISYSAASTPSSIGFKPQTPASCGGSMLVSLLDEDNPPQSLPPPPHVGTSALPPNRILSSPVTAATPLPSSPITAQVPNSNHSTPLTLIPAYPKSSGSSDVLSHLLTSTGNIGVGGSNSTPIGVNSSANSSTQSIPPTIKSTTNSEAGVSKKGRKRRVDPSMGGFISTLPTRAAIMDAMKQPTKPTPSKPALLAKESVYDFEDCPPSTNIAPPPPPPFPPSKPFAFSDVSAPERTAERKSGLKFVIKTNRGGSGGGLTAASATSTTTPAENAAVVTKPRTKAVEGKPFALFKQLQQQQQPSTSSQHPKKERKRRVSSKSKEVQPSLVLSISSPKVFPSAPMVTPAPSPKKHGIVKGKPGRKKTLSTSSEPKRNRFISSDEPPVESGVVAPNIGVSGVGSSGGGNSTNRLIKGYKIPKVRKLPSPPPNNSPPAASRSINQEEATAARAEVTPTATAMSTSLPPPSAPSTISTTTTKSQQRSLLFIVENLKRAVVESSAAPQLHQQQTSSTTVVELAHGSAEGSGDAANIAEDALPADANDNLFEKFSSAPTPTKGGASSVAPLPSKRLKVTPTLGAGVYDLNDVNLDCRPPEDEVVAVAGVTATAPGVNEAEAEREESVDVGATLFGQDGQSDSQTPPASLDEEAAAAGGLIKAPTDTPDSPTESMSTKAFIASSKIIPVSQEPPSGHTPTVPTGAVANSAVAVAVAPSSSPFFNKPLSSGRPTSGTLRGGMARGAAGPRFNYLRSGWSSRPYGSPMIPRGAGGGGGAGRLPLPPWGGGPGGPPQPPPGPGGGVGGSGGWGLPRGGAPLYRIGGGGSGVGVGRGGGVSAGSSGGGGPFCGGGNRQAPPKT